MARNIKPFQSRIFLEAIGVLEEIMQHQKVLGLTMKEMIIKEEEDCSEEPWHIVCGAYRSQRSGLPRGIHTRIVFPRIIQKVVFHCEKESVKELKDYIKEY